MQDLDIGYSLLVSSESGLFCLETEIFCGPSNGKAELGKIHRSFTFMISLQYEFWHASQDDAHGQMTCCILRSCATFHHCEWAGDSLDEQLGQTIYRTEHISVSSRHCD